MENQTNVEYNIFFMRFSGMRDKYDKRYCSYIRRNKNYRLRVDVTKRSPIKKTSKLKLTSTWSEHVFWLNTLSMTGERHLSQTDKNAILKVFENLFKFKILKWPLAVICHYFPSTDKSIL